jgi:hypothetical protein
MLDTLSRRYSVYNIEANVNPDLLTYNVSMSGCQVTITAQETNTAGTASVSVDSSTYDANFV